MNPCNLGSGQAWSLTLPAATATSPAPASWAYIEPTYATTYCLDNGARAAALPARALCCPQLRAASRAAGKATNYISNSATQTYSCNGGSSEYWRFALQPLAVAGALSTSFPYTIVNQASGNCLTGSTVTPIGGQNGISACTGASAQLWWLLPTPFAGYYMVVNNATGARAAAAGPLKRV